MGYGHGRFGMHGGESGPHGRGPARSWEGHGHGGPPGPGDGPGFHGTAGRHGGRPFGRGGRGFGPEGQEGHAGFRGHPGHGGPGGPGGRARRGAARFVLLDVLRDGPKHGYEIIRAIGERSGGSYQPSPGLIYPTLQMLEDLGFVRAEADGERRVYRLTDAGEAELAARAEELRAFWERFAPPAPETQAVRAEFQFLHEELEDLLRTVHGGVHGGANDPETLRRLRKAVAQCKESVRGIIAGVPDSRAADPEDGSA